MRVTLVMLWRLINCRIIIIIIICAWPGVAFRANKVLQTRIAQENAISTLVPLLVDPAVPEETRVEVAYTLACIVLCHADNLQQLHAEDKFSFDVVRLLLCSQSEVGLRVTILMVAICRI